MDFFIVTADVANLKDAKSDGKIFITYTRMPSEEAFCEYLESNEQSVIPLFRSKKDNECINLCEQGIPVFIASHLVKEHGVDTCDGRKMVAEAIRKHWDVQWI